MKRQHLQRQNVTAPGAAILDPVPIGYGAGLGGRNDTLMMAAEG